MRIDCPHCAAAYEVPDSVLTARRLVRCASCGQDWAPAGHAKNALQAETPPDAPPAPALAPPAPTIVTRPLPLAPVSRPAPAHRAVLAAWVTSVAILALAGWSAVKWREPVMHAWPPSARLYKAAGLG